MCFDVKTNINTQLSRSVKNNPAVSNSLFNEASKAVPQNYYHVSGFSHPTMLIYTNKDPNKPILATWGLVPYWIKNKQDQLSIWNKTLNARCETIYQKPSFRASAKNKHCIIHLDGFYEHHHYKAKTYPFYIFQKENKPLSIAGLWSEWTDKETGEILNTFTIVTTQANSLLSKIHNHPKLPESRMPVILKEKKEDSWLNAHSEKEMQALFLPYADDELQAHPVRKIRGKNALGNVKETVEEFNYKELKEF